MSHNHATQQGEEHGHGGHSHGKDASTTRLLIALVLNVGITVAQVVGGLISGSLSLLADAVHNGSDAASLAGCVASPSARPTGDAPSATSARS